MEILNLVKIGGNVIDNPQETDLFIQNFSNLHGFKVLVHGGGKLASNLQKRLGQEPKLVNGRRITDAETLESVIMVYAGLVNKTLVAKLLATGKINPMGFSGADTGLIIAQIRNPEPIDFGFVGDIESINSAALIRNLQMGITPVVCPITCTTEGQLLNTNADTIASELAINLSRHFQVHITYVFEREGVLADINQPDSVLTEIDSLRYQELLRDGKIVDGMLPKLENAFKGLNKGIKSIRLCKPDALLTPEKGTTLKL